LDRASQLSLNTFHPATGVETAWKGKMVIDITRHGPTFPARATFIRDPHEIRKDIPALLYRYYSPEGVVPV
jgi:hypothetical protein